MASKDTVLIEKTIRSHGHLKLITIKNLVIISALLLAVIALDQLIYAVYLITFILALFSVRYALQSMSLVVIFNFLNPALVDLPAYGGIITRLLIFVAVLRILIPNGFKYIQYVVPLFCYFLIVLVLSLFFSRAAEISIMKLVFFCTVVASVIIGFESLSREDTTALKQWFINIAVVVLILSVPTFFVDSVGFKRNGRGFQGILNHPQVYGAFLAPYCAWMLGGILSYQRRYKSLAIAGIITCTLIITIILTKTRTASVAVILGLIAPISFGLIGIIKQKHFRSGRLILIGGGFAFVALCAIIIQPSTMEFVTSFITKDHEERTIGEAFHASRGKAVESHWESFLARPLTGHGFGIYPSGVFPSGVKRFYGIPISASVEKGFLPSAILEETGLIGAAAFLWFLFSLIKRIVASAEASWVCMFFACLFINLGEAVLFSVGGTGLYYWLLMGLCLASAKHAAR